MFCRFYTFSPSLTTFFTPLRRSIANLSKNSFIATVDNLPLEMFTP
jgi:hypothetical protein